MYAVQPLFGVQFLLLDLFQLTIYKRDSQEYTARTEWAFSPHSQDNCSNISKSFDLKKTNRENWAALPSPLIHTHKTPKCALTSTDLGWALSEKFQEALKSGSFSWKSRQPQVILAMSTSVLVIVVVVLVLSFNCCARHRQIARDANPFRFDFHFTSCSVRSAYDFNDILLVLIETSTKTLKYEYMLHELNAHRYTLSRFTYARIKDSRTHALTLNHSLARAHTHSISYTYMAQSLSRSLSLSFLFSHSRTHIHSREINLK